MYTLTSSSSQLLILAWILILVLDPRAGIYFLLSALHGPETLQDQRLRISLGCRVGSGSGLCLVWCWQSFPTLGVSAAESILAAVVICMSQTQTQACKLWSRRAGSCTEPDLVKFKPVRSDGGSGRISSQNVRM
ncbi:hypothetical protein J3E68DRAFT_371918 [Trichoderma sp. SZMC 28012]